jgi:tRNA pseudouridine55 synthase
MTRSSEPHDVPVEPPHGVLIVDKCAGPTSHDVVGVARRALGTREVGHTGTLDPMATGVLVLVVGEATKLVNALTASSKAYAATLKLGSSTTTLDALGEVDASMPVPPFTREQVALLAARFLGEIDQRAPAVSAIKVDGKSLYKRARKGEVFEPPLRRVRLEAIEIGAVREDEVDLSLSCGSGFYVRALARDLAAALGTLGHLTALRRTRNGAYELGMSVSFDQLRSARDDLAVRVAVRSAVIPLATVCRGLPHLVLDDAGVLHARHGRAVPLEHVLPASAAQLQASGTLVAFAVSGVPVALVEPSVDSLRVLRGFRAL